MHLSQNIDTGFFDENIVMKIQATKVPLSDFQNPMSPIPIILYFSSGIIFGGG